MHDSQPRRNQRRSRPRILSLAAIAGLLVALMPAAATAQTDPREGLGSGFLDAEQAIFGMDLIGTFEKPDGELWDPASLDSAFGGISTANSDLTFTGDYALQGNFAGFNIFDISDPANPTLRTVVHCPGGQGDLNVWGDLVFMSVEETRAQLDCTAGPSSGENPNRFRGVRIFDISDIDNPQQVATVQTCRGSHTHRLVPDLNDPSRIYVYVNGTSSVRSGDELEGCANPPATAEDFDEASSRFRIEVIEVPLANPAAAEIVNEPRLFADDEGNIDGLWPGGSHGPGTQNTTQTDACHDITVFPEIGLAAGACEGNGLLLDISDPANPKRIDEVIDPSFAYWHSANFNNDGTAVMFTDEWGGGTAARCREGDPATWGANGLYEIVRTADGPRLQFASHYKLPAAQTAAENCVAHQANVVPVPGRDIMVQAWYQGGISVFDWTDPSAPFEIAYFDRGPIADTLVLGGFWSGYWHNGNVYGTEIARGLDVFDLVETQYLSANELAAAKTVTYDQHNPMTQSKVTWRLTAVVADALRDQADRAELPANLRRDLDKFLDRALRFDSGAQGRAATAQLHALANQIEHQSDASALAKALRGIADARG
ncbi:LVIVD repeat-containing protein [Egicoccus sp. AB-alg6-2]|uniref:LVIVD repeat-containing protein n=1 Tax=Egicoccus sp. AB-alg6-2 TaxID=3242692 RepID=UPI00359EF218